MTTPLAAPPRPLVRRVIAGRVVAFLANQRPARRAGWMPHCGAFLPCLVLALPFAVLLMAPAGAASAPSTTAARSTAAAPAAAASPAAAVAPRWVPPIQPLRVVRRFQPPPAPWAAGHRGVDLAAPASGRVVSAGAGTVVFAGRVAGRGVVVVRTGELRTTYEPLLPSAHVGQAVRPGDLLGTLSGLTHCGPAVCLHWGLLRGETYLDPLTLLTRRAVRLLPLYGPVVVAPPGPADQAAHALKARGATRSGAHPRMRGRRETPTPLLVVAVGGAAVAYVVLLVETRRI